MEPVAGGMTAPFPARHLANWCATKFKQISKNISQLLAGISKNNLAQVLVFSF